MPCTKTIYEIRWHGAVYVGKASRVEKRWRDHKREVAQGSELRVHRYWRKYGEPVEFVRVHERTFDDLSEAERWANNIERALIQARREGPLVCLNIGDGGEGGNNLKTLADERRHLEATRAAMARPEVRVKVDAARIRRSHQVAQWRAEAGLNSSNPWPTPRCPRPWVTRVLLRGKSTTTSRHATKNEAQAAADVCRFAFAMAGV